MPLEASGSGRAGSAKDAAAVRASFGPQIPPLLNLNRARPEELAAHPLVGKALATKLLRFRKKGRIVTPGDLLHAGLIKRHQLRSFESFTCGDVVLRPLMQRIQIDGPRLYVDEEFSLRFSWLKSPAVLPEILSVTARFPSGRTANLHVRLSKENVESGQLILPGFASGESGELYVLAVLRDAAGGVSRQSAIFGVFTRNPVQIFVTPQYTTQSGGAGAPKYNFSENRWYCYADVRWVNGESRSVNLG